MPSDSISGRTGDPSSHSALSASITSTGSTQRALSMQAAPPPPWVRPGATIPSHQALLARPPTATDGDRGSLYQRALRATMQHEDPAGIAFALEYAPPTDGRSRHSYACDVLEAIAARTDPARDACLAVAFHELEIDPDTWLDRAMSAGNPARATAALPLASAATVLRHVPGMESLIRPELREALLRRRDVGLQLPWSTFATIMVTPTRTERGESPEQSAARHRRAIEAYPEHADRLALMSDAHDVDSLVAALRFGRLPHLSAFWSRVAVQSDPKLSEALLARPRAFDFNLVMDLARYGDPALLDAVLTAAPWLVNRTTVSGATPAHEAASRSSMAALAVLKRHGADLNIADLNGHTPLHVLRKYGPSGEKLLPDRFRDSSESVLSRLVVPLLPSQGIAYAWPARGARPAPVTPDETQTPSTPEPEPEPSDPSIRSD